VARSGDLAALIDRSAVRGTHGIFLKAPDEAEIAAAVDRLADRGIPVVTLVTDVANCRRSAYVGMDNRAAGETAAFLVGEWLGGAKGKVLATLSSSRFRGEEEREIGFRRAIRARYPHLGIVDVSEGFGIDSATGALVRKALAGEPDLVAAYSIGGGNRAIVDAFQSMGRACRVFIGHDLDEDNLTLLREQRISAVLNHDLRADMRSACRVVMQAHRVLPFAPPPSHSQVQIITPFNLPNRIS
jgi:LacI family transcriptional regulator